MQKRKAYLILTWCIAAVWIGNGLFCKVLNLVPRHEEIVARILGAEHSRIITLFIGSSEIGMAIWVLSGLWRRWAAIATIVIVAVMNTIEFTLASDLLLWGKLNSLYALLFIIVVYVTEFRLNPKLQQT